MSSGENPWVEVLSQPQQKSTGDIVPYFNEQAKLLSQASDGKVKGLFSQTSEINITLSPTLEALSAMSKVFQDVASASALDQTPKVDLMNADDLYKKNSYCFEIRSDRYRFRVFTIEFDPSYPVVMSIDRGVCNDLEKIHDRYKFKEAEPCNVTIQDDEDLDRVFNQLLKSEKLVYICNRLMNEAN
ncbi:hypothetical protein [Collinsella aerofaciens]|uniref:hypothetical protein n=1 Tax=Collinsella aerofaciens TaxID=74426 RepID=UPI00189CA71B|nr:hypothetical protein [Collinsella aerofaciens]